jgi:hypothetical protein
MGGDETGRSAEPMVSEPFKALDMAAPAVDVEEIDGGRILRSPQVLGPYPRAVGEMLVH